ncbi:MAG: VWA domain-containing protein [Chloroflexi bacterium]|nr:VWA domain-containing protein [Chloroflexota bacterium]MCI0728546.1 VWA domain-containing protein [Chloroflexota bacterium]
MHVQALFAYLGKKWHKRMRGCRRRFYIGLALVILAGLLACGLFGWLLSQVEAAESPPPLSVYLLIDNSNSMFEKGGIGSDPELLRLDAARLFISYLGVDDSQTIHRCSVIFFGSEAAVAVPLTPLTGSQARADLFALIADPPRMDWTDHLAALALAQEQIRQNEAAGHPVVVLLTDGKPEWDGGAPVDQESYLAQLQSQGEQLAAAGIPLFIILLANEATDADPDIAGIWQPAWQAMSQATPPGRFYVARRAEELVGIYHDIVVALAGDETAGPVVEESGAWSGTVRVIEVEPDLIRLTLVVSKSTPDLVVTISSPDGQPITATTPGVRHAGQPGVTHEEIWAIANPAPGRWLVSLTGEGQVTIWKDYQVAPPSPAPLSPTELSPTPWAATAAPSLTPSRPATATPLPTETSTPPSTATPTRPASVVLAAPDDFHAELSSDHPAWPWFIVPTLLAAGGGYTLWRRQKGTRLPVTGSLRLLSGPAQATASLAGQANASLAGHPLIELDTLKKSRATIGQAPADFPLPGAMGRLVIRPGAPMADSYEMVAEGSGEVLLDNEPLTGPRRLADAAILTIGAQPGAAPHLRGAAYCLRYENLRLRALARAAEIEIRRTSYD